METLKNNYELLGLSEISVCYRPSFKASQRPQVTSASAAYELFLHSWDLGKIGFLEEFKVLLLNRANRVLGLFTVSQGGISGTVADPKVIFATALKCGSPSLILAHNHPSAGLKPSQEDLNLTRQLAQGAKLLDIQILDHLIVTEEAYFSFADERLL